MKYQDYYQTLGVSRDASGDEIKGSYRRLARKFHPDVSEQPNAEERFKEIGEAYEVLKDSDKRARYDQLGANWKAGQDFTPPPGWEGAFNFGGFGGAGGSQGPVDFSDFFSAMFGDRAGARHAGARHAGARHAGFSRGPTRGRDQTITVRIDIEDAFHGAERLLRLQTGNGATQGTRKLNIKIPAGVTDGQQIRLAGQGQPGVNGGARGDLFLQVEIEPHSTYRVEGKDVYLDLPITPWEAALGATIEVPTLGGKVDLKIPNGTSSGSKLRLKGRGLGGKRSGDQYVVLQIATPPADSQESRELYRQMSEQMPFNPREHLD